MHSLALGHLFDANKIASRYLISDLTRNRLAKAKQTYTTRAVPQTHMATLLTGSLVPHPGDLMLARVERINCHKAIDTPEGRRTHLFPGDEVLVCYGPRYAPDQFEATMPEELGPCHLVAAGGVAARVVSTHAAIGAPTTLIPQGIIGDPRGKPLNIAQWKLRPLDQHVTIPLIVAVVGTSMNSGKTTSAAHFIRGLTSCGLKVGAAKVTGTGSPRDVGLFKDAGAIKVLDFTDAGHASTANLANAEIVDVFNLLIQHLASASVDVIVIEIADGLLQAETANLILSDSFRTIVKAVLFASGEAMGAVAGADWLTKYGLPVKAMTGLVTASPLASLEAQKITKLPILTLKDLAEPASLDSFSFIAKELVQFAR